MHRVRPSYARKLLAATFTLWLLGGVALLAQTTGKDAFTRVSDKLICQCGCNYGLSYCPHLECPSAPVLRATIREKLAAGLSEQQVLDAMVAQYGPAILAAPPAQGFNLTAWVMPFVALALGLWLAIVVIRRWRRRAPVQASDPALVDRYRHRLEREMKELEK